MKNYVLKVYIDYASGSHEGRDDKYTRWLTRRG